ncbi:MAG: helix-turn-helix domain-containing protein [Planctomycetaceae bacterium]|nr:MAG: helix-turn-helix domain-containing protein [Planctomycetaceae bacterium]
MPLPPAPPLSLRPGDREKLETMVRKQTLAQRQVARARLLLLCAEGLPHREIKRRLGTSVGRILRWRSRYEERGLDGIHDLPRPGRPPAFSPSAAASDRHAGYPGSRRAKPSHHPMEYDRPGAGRRGKGSRRFD